MSLFRRGPVVPAEVLDRSRQAGNGLGRRERVLAWTRSREGTWLLGTRDALVIVPGTADAEAASVATRIPWQRVEAASWDRDEELLRITGTGGFGHPRPVHGFRAEDPALLLQLIRERVTASVVMQRRVSVEGRKGFYVIARRPPGGHGEITWAYQFDVGVDPADPAVRTAAEQALTTAAEELGDVAGAI